ncbi:MAG: propionyl-CoA carboxylase regulator [Alphaproteobacteria bacterium]|nr:MAG: propionyl-CoA carboxylase regulator [Alphaproteobacteria bacterium]
MAQNLTGLKIRSKRKLAGLTQGELARRAGISPSYLNLIEQSKRPIAGGMVDRIAQGLGVDRAELDGEAERRIVYRLNEIGADPAITDGADPPEPAEELVGRSPGWARLVLRLYQALQDRNDAVLALADRLNRDPFLSVSVHRALTDVTAIHSAAEILESGADLTPVERRRFMSIVSSGSARLSQTAQALAGFFESAHTRVRSATPMEHVDAFIFQTGNYFPELEDAAAGVLAGPDQSRRLEDLAAAIIGEPQAAAAESRGAEPYQSAESRRFALLKQAAGRFAGDAIESIVRHHPALGSDEARRIAAAALHSYTAAALLMPYEPFLEAAERCRYDVDVLAGLFGASYEQVAHRLATLRRPGAEGVRFAFMRSDPSGYITKRLPLPRLPLPRYGNACPMWVIYSAFQTPGVTVRSFGELMSGDQFLFFARALQKRPQEVGQPRHLLSVMLVCQAGEAGRVVYGDGIDWRSGRAMVPLGTTCRLCRRSACSHRQEERLMPA